MKEFLEIAKLIGDPAYIAMLIVIWMLYKIITTSLVSVTEAINKQAGTLEKLATLMDVMVNQGRNR